MFANEDNIKNLSNDFDSEIIDLARDKAVLGTPLLALTIGLIASTFNSGTFLFIINISSSSVYS